MRSRIAVGAVALGATTALLAACTGGGGDTDNGDSATSANLYLYQKPVMFNYWRRCIFESALFDLDQRPKTAVDLRSRRLASRR